jgi:2,4-dienoyl-CoA reductase-like NADH-dependent reductase (Old Yellow Enzyme family)/thioredoxin reductase
MRNSTWGLFEPIKINRLEMKNRIVMLPMGNKLHSSIGEVTQKLIDYYVERAKGGTGLIIVQSADVTDESEQNLRICSDDYVSGLNDLAESIKMWGARVAIQLVHRGYGPADGFTINDLGEEKIRKLVEAFGKAAERAKRAGYEAVEIHGAHGYLIAQFLSGFSNKRTDSYGGTLGRRMAFPIQVYRRVRAAVGEQFPVFFRISGEEFVPGGITKEESSQTAETLEREGINLISLSAGRRGDTPEWITQPMAMPRGVLTPFSSELKKRLTIPVLVAGRINDPVLANSIIEEGKADLVGMGRGLIADPWFPRKALQGELEEIRRCVACNHCQGKRNYLKLSVRCAINPQAGKEREAAVLPARRRRRVLVVGGGPGGLECAHTLYERGHEVLLFEKMPQLGGKLLTAAVPPHKEERNELRDFLVKRAKRERISLFLNHEADAPTVREVQPEVLVFANGANPIFPAIPGLNRNYCYTAEEALNRDLPEDEILILGGGLVGCEVAEFLAAKRKRVTLFEILPDLGTDLEPYVTRKLLLRRLMDLKPTLHTSTEVYAVEGKKALYHDGKGREGSCTFDAIVFAVGFSPDEALIKSMEHLELETFRIGDCVTPRGIFEAIHEGSMIGRSI